MQAAKRLSIHVYIRKIVFSLQELKHLMQAALASLKTREDSGNGLSNAAQDVVTDFGRLWASHSNRDATSHDLNGVASKVKPSEAAHILDVVKRACGPASKDLLQRLTPLSSKLLSSSIQVRYHVVESSIT